MTKEAQKQRRAKKKNYRKNERENENQMNKMNGKIILTALENIVACVWHPCLPFLSRSEPGKKYNFEESRKKQRKWNQNNCFFL